MGPDATAHAPGDVKFTLESVVNPVFLFISSASLIQLPAASLIGNGPTKAAAANLHQARTEIIKHTH